MTSCDNDHEEIFFASPFRALCPLCAMRVRLTEEFQKELDDYREALENCEIKLEKTEGELEGEKTIRETKSEQLETAESELKELRAYKEAHP